MTVGEIKEWFNSMNDAQTIQLIIKLKAQRDELKEQITQETDTDEKQKLQDALEKAQAILNLLNKKHPDNKDAVDAQKRVRKSMTTCRNLLASHEMPLLAKHLEQSVVAHGSGCCYRPQPQLTWEF